MSHSFVTACQNEFRLNNTRFEVSGVNCYFLAYCADDSRRSALALAKQMGANVIRCWAFLNVDDFSPGRVAFQHFCDGAIAIHDGPDGLQRLDALIQAADQLNLKLILPLVNHWDDLGGMPTYVRWLSPGCEVTEFYRQPAIRAGYKNWVSAVLTRRNTLTGRLYSEEPAIMAWELTNEARCPGPGGRELLLGWATEMADFVKLHDSNHLLALGDEGFFHKPASGHPGSGHLYDGRYGVDWLANLAVDNIDFGTFHFYPQAWGYEKNLNFGRRWIREHIIAARRLGKPALMEEFGLKLDGRTLLTARERSAWFATWIHVVQKNQGAGQLLWMLGHQAPDTTEFRDDYTIYEAD